MKRKIKKSKQVDDDGLQTDSRPVQASARASKKRVTNTPSNANVSTNAKDRTKFRATREWKDFKASIIKDRDLRCECCGRYTKTLTLHHKNMDKTHYTNISDKTHFSLLCLSCHSSVHHFHTQVNKKKATPNQMIIDFIKPFFV